MEDLYINSKDNLCRYILGKNGKNPLIFFGINPSTATPEKYDRTIIKIQNISKIKNYDSWIMLNIYPQRATDPKNLDKNINEIIHNENVELIKNVVKNNSAIVAAWGNIINKRYYLINCLIDIAKQLVEKQIIWYSIGNLSQRGNPRHPLYLKANEELKTFDIEYYIKNYNKK